MKRIRNLSHWARAGLIILLILAFCGGGAAFGQVLCIGFNGQVDFEEGANGVCNMSGVHKAHDAALNLSATHDNSHSEPCVDIEIGTGPVVKEVTSADSLAATSLVVWLDPNPAVGKTRHQNQASVIGLQSLYQVIRTTILLI